jgi:hypothetical protein
MKTYFIRHSKTWDICPDHTHSLFIKRQIAIAFEDVSSINPHDYKNPKSQSSISKLAQLAKEGGYVCSTFLDIPGCLVGKVEKDSLIEFVHANRPAEPNRPAILKVLQLPTSTRLVDPDVANKILVAQPQGTICEWRAVEDRVKQLFEKGKIEVRTFADLLFYEVEVMCAEFLRTEMAKQEGLPEMRYLTARVGGSKAVVDFSGVSDENKDILAQVTYYKNTASQLKQKIKTLKELQATKSIHLLMFCQCEAPYEDGSVKVYPVERVFEFMKKCPIWKRSVGF